MSADKHPAKVLADWHDSAPYVPNSFGRKTAELLRSIPALEAECDQRRTELAIRHERQHETEALAGQYLVQRDDARAERDQLRARFAASEASEAALIEALEQIATQHGQWNNGMWAAGVARAAIAKTKEARRG